MGTRRPKRARRLVIGALAVVGVVVALGVALPFIISADVVKQRIVDQITYWTGRDFKFRGDARLSLYPYLTVRLRDAKLANAEGMGKDPFIEAETMTGKLEILPLLIGRLEFAEFRLVNPRINLKTDVEGRGNWILEQGAVGSQVSKGDKEGISEELAPPSPLADIRLGRLVIRDGIVNYTDDRSGRRAELTKVETRFSWTSTSQAAEGAGSFIWRGEPVDFNGSVDAPLALLAGGSSPLRFAFSATPLRLSFTGTALQLDGTQLEGDISLTTPSVRRVVEWMGTPMGAGAIFGAGSVAGTINWLGPSVAISDATIELDGNAAEGALSATIAGGLSRLQGTLAFETLDLTPYMEAMEARLIEGGAWSSAPAGLPIAGIGDIDLRLSTNELIAGSTTIDRTGATAILKDGQLTVTVGEAQVGDGFAEARLSMAMDGDAMVTAAQLKLNEVSLETLGGFAGITALTGSVDASANVGSRGRTWGEVIEGLTGKASLAIADGAIDGVDIAELPGAFADPGSFVLGGTTAFTAATCTMAFADGRVSTEDFHAEGEAFALAVSGRADLLTPVIEARGVLTLDGPEGQAEDVPFMIEGTWSDWRLRPDLGPPVERGTPTPRTTPATERPSDG